MNLGPILNPLRYASRRDFANLGTLKDLEATLQRGLATVRAQPGLPANARAALDAVGPLLEGLDAAPDPERRRRVQTMLVALVPLGGEPPPPSRPPSSPSRPPPLSSRPPLLSSRPPLLSSRTGGVSVTRASTPSSAPRPSGSRVPEDGGFGAPDAPLPSHEDAGSPRSVGAQLVLAAPKVDAPRVARRTPLAKAQPDSRLADVVGVGPKTAERFSAKGFETVQDLMFFAPRQYEDRSRFTPVAGLVPGERATVRGQILAAQVRPTGRGKRLLEIAVSDGTGVISCRFFRFPSRMEARYPPGTPVVVSGTVTAWGAQRQMVHPDLEPQEDANAAPQGILPVYGEVEGVPPKSVRRIVQGLARACGHRVADILPAGIRQRYGLPSLADAVVRVHLPQEGGAGPGLRADSGPASSPPQEALGWAAVERMRSRLAFDELLLLQLALSRTRAARDDEPGLVHAPEGVTRETLARELLPFSLTGAQSRALGEILADMAAPRPMNRLLQGDVGSGKTAVALLASAAACAAGRQAAILAPTEILADQHFNSASKTLGGCGLQIARLTGSARAKERRQLLRALADRQVHVVVGTHALLEPDVVFADLGLAVVDEQHRFGVQQRVALRTKRHDAMPDLLLMTATPIPRTLALTAYGDLRVSVIDELPPGRSPTVTEVFAAAQSERALDGVAAALAEGRQAYIVYPLVEASEKLDLTAATDAARDLSERFRPHEVALLHGRMRAEEKAAVMKRFKAGKVGVLISTTVIEVGVDVPNATVMLVQHADRFGLSQLHQLRGRVGRGAHRGTCLLVAGDASNDGWARLQVLAQTNDGFAVAEHDLELRGPGEVLGTRQSGLPDLAVANLARDGRLVEHAREAAGRLMADDPGLVDPEHAWLRRELDRRFGARLELTKAG